MNSKINVIVEAARIGIVFMLFILITGSFIPLMVSAFVSSVSDQVTFQESICHPVSIVVSVIGVIISFLVVSSKLDDHKKELKEARFRN